jgi:hypothetical protein
MILPETSRAVRLAVIICISVFQPFGLQPLPAQEPIVGIAPFPPAVVISGTAYERGRLYGGEFREAIRSFYEEEIVKPFVDQPASRDEMLGYATACVGVIRDECPMIAHEIEGIAQGAGLTVAEVTLIQLHEELYHRRPLPMPGHCTAVAVAPAETGDGQTLVGQTWDWMQSVVGKSAVLEWRRDDGTRVLAYGFPGMPFGAGLNSQGIALCWTSAALDDTGKAPRVGLPSYTLIAHLLSQPDLDSVIRAAQRDRHAGWFTFVMADGDGNLVNIEGSPDGVAIETSRQRLVRVGYGTRRMTGTNPQDGVSTHPRCQHLCRLLDGSRGQTRQETLQSFFADPAKQISVGKPTIDMMVFNTTARTASLSRGPDYGVSWREFRFTRMKESRAEKSTP